MASSLIPYAFFICLFSVDEGLDKARLEKWLSDPDGAELIVQTFRRYPDHVLGFIDEYMEGGLKMIEEGKSEDEAMNSFRVGLRFGKLADKAFGETIFTKYTASFASWSPAERKRFREGQKEYRAGKAAMKEPAKALEHFEKSLKLAEPLGDSWGTAMALAGIVEAGLRIVTPNRSNMVDEQVSETKMRSERAIAQYERLRLRKAQIEALFTGTEFGHATGSGMTYNLLQIEQSLRANDEPEFRRMTIDRCLRILEEAEQPEEANAMRKRAGVVPSSTTQPGKN